MALFVCRRDDAQHGVVRNDDVPGLLCIGQSGQSGPPCALVRDARVQAGRVFEGGLKGSAGPVDGAGCQSLLCQGITPLLEFASAGKQTQGFIGERIWYMNANTLRVVGIPAPRLQICFIAVQSLAYSNRLAAIGIGLPVAASYDAGAFLGFPEVQNVRTVCLFIV